MTLLWTILCHLCFPSMLTSLISLKLQDDHLQNDLATIPWLCFFLNGYFVQPLKRVVFQTNLIGVGGVTSLDFLMSESKNCCCRRCCCCCCCCCYCWRRIEKKCHLHNFCSILATYWDKCSRYNCLVKYLKN